MKLRNSGEVFGNTEITISVSDITGKKMSNISFTDYNKIDLGELKAGIYFVKISNNLVSKVCFTEDTKIKKLSERTTFFILMLT